MDRRAEAIERRIRPIYDKLDSRNVKGALKLAIAALEKYPDSSLVKALYSVVLVRARKKDEAHKVCDELVGSVQLEEQTLHLLLLTLKDLQRPHDITRLYEAAHAKEPNNPDFLIGLFNSHVREGGFAKQQQVATRLNKLCPCSLHLWWIALSIMLQARAAMRGDSVSALEPAKLLQLAESMVARQAAKDGKLDGFEALLVYVDLLLAQGKVQEASDLVAGPLGAVASMAAERSYLQASLLMAAGKTSAAAALLADLLRHNPDDWSVVQLYSDCLMGSQAVEPQTADDGVAHLQWPDSSLLRLSGGLAELLPTPGAPPAAAAAAAAGQPGAPAAAGAAAAGSSGAPAAAAAAAGAAAGAAALQLSQSDLESGHKAALTTVAEMVAQVEASATVGDPNRRLTMRGPYLASVEVAQRAAARGLAPELDVAESAWAYIQQQGHLVSCAVDLRPYTSKLGTEAAAWLAQQLQPLLLLLPAEQQQQQLQLAAVRKAVCCRQVLDDLGLPKLASPEAAVAYAGELMAGYAAVQPLYRGLDERERRELMAGYAAAQPLYRGLDERERGPADELPCLAASSLVTAAALSSSHEEAVGQLMQAVLLLEACTLSRPFSAPMRLALAALYTLLGCPEAVHRHCRHLEIKNIQMDTLAGHHLLPALLAYAPCCQQQLQGVLRETLRLFSDHQKEAADTLSKAYQGGTYSKVLEFVAFKERLDAAHTRAVARAEEVILAVCEALPQGLEAATSAASAACADLALTDLPQLDGSGASRLRLNEDLSTRPTWYPPSAGPAHLAACDWWQGRQLHSGQGYGRKWWAGSGSAESAAEQAVEMRRDKAAAVKSRWLLPHLVAGVLLEAGSQEGGGAGGGQQGLPLPAAVEDLASCCGIELGGVSEQLQQRSQAVAVTGPEPRDLQLLQVCVFAYAAQVASPAKPTGDGSSSDGSSAGMKLPAISAALLGSFLEAVAAALARSLAEAAAAGQHVVPGSLLNLASVLLNEQLAMLVLFMQAWSRTAKHDAKKKPKVELPGTQPQTSLSDDIILIRNAAVLACRSLDSVLQSFNRPPPEVPIDAALAAKLWGWQAGFDAAARAQDVLREQARVAGLLCSMAHRHLKALGMLTV